MLQVVVFVVLELTLILSYFPQQYQTCCNVSDKKYNRNSSGQLTQTCPTLAIKTATVLELVRRVEEGEVE